jgi:diadenosine tetraphosphatase ApaH/serine/threonine PP2A family protein phosphatase
VGSVGQPRDGDPRACYAIVNDEKMEIIRVPYDIEAVQDKMRKADLPSLLIERLSKGR